MLRNASLWGFLSAALLAFLPGQSWAETYSGLSFGASSSSFDDDGSPEGTAIQGRLTGFWGSTLDSGGWIEGIIRGESGQRSAPANNDSLLSGGVIAGRYSRQISDNSRLEFGAGLVTARTLEGTTDRYFLFAANERRLGDNWQIYGRIGLLDGTGGTDDSGLDGLRSYTHIDVESTHRLSDRVNLVIGGSLGIGRMDDDADHMIGSEVSLGLTYAFNRPGMTGYARMLGNRFGQIEEAQYATERRLELGIVWHFRGDVPASRNHELARYEDWMATTAGILE